MNIKSEASNENRKLPSGQLSVYKEKDIFFVGYTGLSGTRDIITSHREELLLRYPVNFLDEIFSDEFVSKALDCEISDNQKRADEPGGRSTCDANAHGIMYMSECGKGGVLEALYLMCKELSLGIYVDLQLVPILFQTIEIGEHFEKNPYALDSAGCILGITSNYQDTKRYFEAKGFNIKNIGRTTSDKAKILKRGEEEGNLNRPGRNG